MNTLYDHFIALPKFQSEKIQFEDADQKAKILSRWTHLLGDESRALACQTLLHTYTSLPSYNNNSSNLKPEVVEMLDNKFLEQFKQFLNSLTDIQLGRLTSELDSMIFRDARLQCAMNRLDLNKSICPPRTFLCDLYGVKCRKCYGHDRKIARKKK